MPYNHFDYVPSGISKSRSVFKFSKVISAGCDIGYLYPMCKPVPMLPGSSLKLNLAMEVRSGALIAPLQDEILLDVYAFKVPNRIVWEHWKQFLGSVDDVLFDNLTEYQIPSFLYCGFQYDEGWNKPFVASRLLACCFELPAFNYRAGTSPYTSPRISALPFRGYNFIWNEFFRPEQLVQPILFSKTDAGYTGDNMEYGEQVINSVHYTLTPATGLGTDIPKPGGCVLPTFRVHKSLWTSCLPKPSLETLNLLGDLQAPVGYIGSQSVTTSVSNVVGSPSGVTVVPGDFYQVGSGSSAYGDVIADLSQAILTVNNYRETIMLQNYYDALNRAGSRYDEIIRNIFHVQTNFAVIDIPELIVHKRFTIFRKDVVSTARTETDAGVITQLGQQASYIDTVVKDSFFTTSMTEHGYVHLLYTIRPARIRMAQGIEPDWSKLDKFDMYYPQFDGMGDVPRYKKELYLADTAVSGDLDAIFGYQEYGAEYKYQRNSAVGWTDVNLTNHIAGLTLCEQLSAQPTLAAGSYYGIGSYISCAIEAIAFAKCLGISNNQVAPQFIVDIRLNGEIVHPMPVYNIPGMGDLL